MLIENNYRYLKGIIFAYDLGDTVWHRFHGVGQEVPEDGFQGGQEDRGHSPGCDVRDRGDVVTLDRGAGNRLDPDLPGEPGPERAGTA